MVGRRFRKTCIIKLVGMQLKYSRYGVLLVLIWLCTFIIIVPYICHNNKATVDKGGENILIKQKIQPPVNEIKPITEHFEKPKIILFWNDLFGKKDWNFPLYTTKAFENLNCDVTNCLFTAHRDDVFFADAVYFHLTLADRPAFRLPYQRWIFLRHEAPYSPPFIHPFENLINWTQGYRPDSDIYMSYGEYCRRDQPLKIDFKTIVKRKTKKVAWFVSNCHVPSKRIEYAKELMKHIDIDVYGACSHLLGQNNQCQRIGLGENCYKMIEEKYKFYLSFESCFHNGYLTEKYFHLIQYNIVPIVRGDGNYSEVVPNSYISTKDFPSVEKLANYLNYLDKNDDAYISYLKHREIYRGDYGDTSCKGLHELAYCKLCRKLNDPTEPRKVYPDLQKWYGTCRDPDDIK